MRLYLLAIALLLLLFPERSLSAQSASETACFITGQLSTTVVAGGALATCTATGHPVACAVAFKIIDCAGNPACDGVVSTLTEAGCNIVVSRSGQLIEFTVKTTEKNVTELRKTYEALDTAEGIIWLGKHLSR